MKFVEPNPFTDPDATARKLLEIANATEPAQDGRIYIELVNAAFLKAGGTAERFRAGLAQAIASGWLWRHESGTYVKFTAAGAELFARSGFGTKGLAMRSEVHAMAATVFICAAVSISQASAYPSIVAVASPPTVSASRHYTHHRTYATPPHTRCQYHYFPRYEWNPGCGHWWDYP